MVAHSKIDPAPAAVAPATAEAKAKAKASTSTSTSIESRPRAFDSIVTTDSCFSMQQQQQRDSDCAKIIAAPRTHSLNSLAMKLGLEQVQGGKVQLKGQGEQQQFQFDDCSSESESQSGEPLIPHEHEHEHGSDSDFDVNSESGYDFEFDGDALSDLDSVSSDTSSSNRMADLESSELLVPGTKDILNGVILKENGTAVDKGDGNHNNYGSVGATAQSSKSVGIEASKKKDAPSKHGCCVYLVVLVVVIGLLVSITVGIMFACGLCCFGNEVQVQDQNGGSETENINMEHEQQQNHQQVQGPATKENSISKTKKPINKKGKGTINKHTDSTKNGAIGTTTTHEQNALDNISKTHFKNKPIVKRKTKKLMSKKGQPQERQKKFDPSTKTKNKINTIKKSGSNLTLPISRLPPHQKGKKTSHPTTTKDNKREKQKYTQKRDQEVDAESNSTEVQKGEQADQKEQEGKQEKDNNSDMGEDEDGTSADVSSEKQEEVDESGRAQDQLLEQLMQQVTKSRDQLERYNEKVITKEIINHHQHLLKVSGDYNINSVISYLESEKQSRESQMTSSNKNPLQFSAYVMKVWQFLIAFRESSSPDHFAKIQEDLCQLFELAKEVAKESKQNLEKVQLFSNDNKTCSMGLNLNSTFSELSDFFAIVVADFTTIKEMLAPLNLKQPKLQTLERLQDDINVAHEQFQKLTQFEKELKDSNLYHRVVAEVTDSVQDFSRFITSQARKTKPGIAVEGYLTTSRQFDDYRKAVLSSSALRIAINEVRFFGCSKKSRAKLWLANIGFHCDCEMLNFLYKWFKKVALKSSKDEQLKHVAAQKRKAIEDVSSNFRKEFKRRAKESDGLQGIKNQIERIQRWSEKRDEMAINIRAERDQRKNLKLFKVQLLSKAKLLKKILKAMTDRKSDNSVLTLMDKVLEAEMFFEEESTGSLELIAAKPKQAQGAQLIKSIKEAHEGVKIIMEQKQYGKYFDAYSKATKADLSYTYLQTLVMWQMGITKLQLSSEVSKYLNVVV